ncbi:hypothetical protein [Chitinophaga varians]|uniref:hypothetical protein n=1 Tax=Chitinophaga varians TaxID=2202339 RepID=UPI00165FB019|nr:hypothetical protein [Chitinophaga varians]MBC9908853.1 hypothetical protein [Chitinophaga varians]
MENNAYGQQQPHVLPGYYNASRMEVAEELCIFENNRFVYAMSYGALDVFVKGMWTQQHDTIYLSTDKVKGKYVVTSSTDEKVPAGKMLLIFKFGYQHAPYINFSFTSPPVTTPHPEMTQVAEGFQLLINQPASRQLWLVHTMYDTEFSAYTLPEKVNKVVIGPGDGLGKPVFNNIPFLVSDSCVININDEHRKFRYTGPVSEEDKRYAQPDNK